MATESGVLVHEMAESMFNLCQKIIHEVNPESQIRAFADISLEEQAPWNILALKGTVKMQSLEGASFKDLAFELLMLIQPGDGKSDEECKVVWDGLTDRYRLMWEAVAHHLHTMVECDELGSPAESEDMYVGWFKKKLAERESEPKEPKVEHG